MKIEKYDKYKVLTDIARLANYMSPREQKYIRAYNRYYSNGAVSDSIHNLYSLPPCYVPDFGVSGVKTKRNIQSSIVDTMASKLSQLKVRPFFNPVDGTTSTVKACRHAQIFFDRLFSEKKIPQLVAESTRDALLFDVGELWVDDKKGVIESVKPYNVYVDPIEYQYGAISRLCLIFKQYPAQKVIADIDEYGSGEIKIDSTKRKIENELINNRSAYHDYCIYYDLHNGFRVDFFEQDEIFLKKIDFKNPPVVFLFYKKPVKGFFSVSVIDETYGLQAQVDEMGDRVDMATRNAPFNYVVMSRTANSQIKQTQFSNEPCIIIEYDGIAGETPPSVVTPAPISGAYQSIISDCKNEMYEQVGVSQLSAQSKKPAGVTSGVALQTLQDVESDRFNVLVNDVIEAYVTLAKILIEVLPDNAEILPPTITRREGIKWQDVKKANELFSIQFSATSSLSKDPSTKLDQINNLIQMGFITKETACKFLEMPDLEKALGESTAPIDYVDYIIETALDRGEVEFFEVVDLNFLFQRTVSAFCRVAQTGDEKAIENCKRLLEAIEEKRQALIAPQEVAPPVEELPPQGQALPTNQEVMPIDNTQIPPM